MSDELATPVESQAHIDPTTRGKRFLNYILDMIGVNIIVALVTIAGVASGGYDPSGEAGSGLAVALLCSFIYYIACEVVWGKTPAKFITKTKVVTTDGTQPAFGVIAIRTLCRIIPFEQLSFVFSDHPVGWHDRFSKTMVTDA